jgi:hypothetical protein
MEPTTGRLVHYTLTKLDATSINKRRQDAVDSNRSHTEDGVQLHFGNKATEGDVLPMLIIKVWSSGSVNGQVFLDGNDTFWATSVSEASGPFNEVGRWVWPPRI